MKKKLTESISLKFRKKLMVSRMKTFLIMMVLLMAYVALILFIESKDLPKLDVTENKIFSISDESKKEVSKVEQDVDIMVYGYEENSNVVDLLKQYNKENEKIHYEMITDETNPDIISTYGLQSGDQCVIIQVGETNKLLSSYDFSTYDYETYEAIDLTENAITNAILNLTIANKPVIYFLTGHNELSIDEYYSQMVVYLQNEVFEYKTLNLLTVEAIPEDCNLIAAMTPQKDLLDQEVELLKGYINNGGNLLIASDLLNPAEADLPKWQSIMDLYGLTFENGVIYELDDNYCIVSNDGQRVPYIFYPHIEDTEITSNIKSGMGMLLENVKKIKKVDEETQSSLKVTYTDLLKTSEKSLFLTDFSQNGLNSLYASEKEESLIAVKATKEVGVEGENTENNTSKTSALIAIGNGIFVSNLQSAVNSNISQVSVGDNMSFFINCVANLTDRTDTITVRKNTNSASYLFRATAKQNIIVLIIIFLTPVIIIITGIVVWNVRKRKK